MGSTVSKESTERHVTFSKKHSDHKKKSRGNKKSVLKKQLSPIPENKVSSSGTKKDSVTTITTTALVEDAPKDNMKTGKIVAKRKAPPPPTIHKQTADRVMNQHFNEIRKADDAGTSHPVPTRRAPPPPTADRPIPTRRAPQLPTSADANISVGDGSGDASTNPQDQGAIVEKCQHYSTLGRPIKGRAFVSALTNRRSMDQADSAPNDADDSLVSPATDDDSMEYDGSDHNDSDLNSTVFIAAEDAQSHSSTDDDSEQVSVCTIINNNNSSTADENANLDEENSEHIEEVDERNDEEWGGDNEDWGDEGGEDDNWEASEKGDFDEEGEIVEGDREGDAAEEEGGEVAEGVTDEDEGIEGDSEGCGNEDKKVEENTAEANDSIMVISDPDKGVDDVTTKDEEDIMFEEMTRRFNDLRRENNEYDPELDLINRQRRLEAENLNNFVAYVRMTLAQKQDENCELRRYISAMNREIAQVKHANRTQKIKGLEEKLVQATRCACFDCHWSPNRYWCKNCKIVMCKRWLKKSPLFGGFWLLDRDCLKCGSRVLKEKCGERAAFIENLKVCMTLL